MRSSGKSRDTSSASPSNNKESYQGPHNWRQSLKPVRLAFNEVDPRLEKDCTDGDRLKKTKQKEEKFDDNKILERLKTMPSWKKDLDEKSRKKRRPVSRHGSAAESLQQSQSRHGSAAESLQSSQTSTSMPNLMRKRSFNRPVESTFTQQVVNSENQPYTFGFTRKRVSPSNSFKQAGFLGKKNLSATVPNDFNTDSQLTKKRIEKVQRARLYLLQQNGPNSFLIGGDSPDHKFRVIIGSQTCSCGKGPHCVHVLFVMLRVFQISETDPCLWSRTLKNYEVETLFRSFHHKRTSRIKNRSPENTQHQSRLPSPQPADLSDPGSPEPLDTNPESDAGSAREDDDTCPICLLEMLEGESLLKCENGCQNRLHHHCITVWFELCRRQGDALICPLCRAAWKATNVQVKSNEDQATNQDIPCAPPNTRAPSPTPDTESRLPYTEPIPQECMELAKPWIQVFGEELVSCFFSRIWSIRETGLKHLSKEMVATLLRGAGEGRSGSVVSPTRQETTHQMLECCCGVLAFLCSDPVYRVFVASLRTLRTMLSYTPCRDELQRTRLQGLVKPIIEAIITKCTDGNRRTNQLSLSTITEIAKGQQGELAVGKEIVNPGTGGLGGLQYVIKSVAGDYDAADVAWDWLLGRLYVLDRLLSELCSEFIPKDSLDSSHTLTESSEVRDGTSGETGHPHNYDLIIVVAKFAVKAFTYSHQRICKMAKRVFVLVARFAAPIDSIINELDEMLGTVESNFTTVMRKKLNKIVEDFRLSERIVNELQHGCKNRQSDQSPVMTPVDTPISTPRCNSPVTCLSEYQSEASSVTQNFVPSVPPNTPKQSRILSRVDMHLEQIESADISDNDGEDVTTVPRQVCEMYSISEAGGIVTPPYTPEHTADNEPTAPILNSPNKTNLNLEKPNSVERQKIEHQSDILNNNELVVLETVQNGAQFVEDLGENSLNALICENESCDVSCGSLNLPPSLDLDESLACDESLTENDSSLGPYDQVSALLDDSSAISFSQTGTEGTSSESILDDDQGAMSSDDLLDLNSSLDREEQNRLVTFQTEITSTVRESVGYTEHKDGFDCLCKEEVEIEEALALAKAMEVSTVDPPTPVVPGLTPTDREELMTIRIQPETNNLDGSLNANQPMLYLENLHWVKGILLGTGAYSTCFQARDVKTGIIMAVKQISYCRNSKTEQEKVIETIREEVQMMSKLNHPNVVRILGATQQGCHFNMFVEWMPGGSVSWLLGQYGAFSEHVTISYTLQILRGLAYLHDNHLLHRDLKGANLLVDSTGQRLRIGDFGAAARLASQATVAGEFQGQLLGTIAFMAPEVLRGENYGRACDVWSIGCVIIEMCTTKPPWNARDLSNHLALIFKIASSERPPPVPENISPPLRDLMLRCLEQRKEERPTAKDLLLHPLFTQYMQQQQQQR